MTRLVLLLLAFIVPAYALNLSIVSLLQNLKNATLQQTTDFFDFIKAHKKDYGTADELKTRFETWKGNMAEIAEELAGAKRNGYQIGSNFFADMNPAERQKFVMRADLADEADGRLKREMPRAKRAVYTYTGETIDWRFTGYMPAVRNQGSCGSCYAFAAINAIEVQWNWLGHNAAFSEQQIVDCAGSNQGCNGGWPEKVFNYSKYYGNAAQSAYPYKAAVGTCYNTARTMTVSTWYQLTTVAQMESYNYYYGPVAFSMYVPNALYSYTGGIFYPTQSTCSSTSNVGAHAMTIVGYGSENGVPYWIVRNSWGATWGEGGYFRMRKGVNNCGMETRGVFFPWLIGNNGAGR
ncbi:unnamed protein product, partial [Mesorhabditis spiculigera]